MRSVYLTLDVDSDAEAEPMFSALSDGGQSYGTARIVSDQPTVKALPGLPTGSIAGQAAGSARFFTEPFRMLCSRVKERSGLKQFVFTIGRSGG
jgi:hypothetical protein